MHKRPQVRLLILRLDRDSYHSALKQSKQRIGFAALPFQKKCRLGQDWLAGQQRRAKEFPLLASPQMTLQSGGKETYQRAGIKKARTLLHWPNHPCIWDFRPDLSVAPSRFRQGRAPSRNTKPRGPAVVRAIPFRDFSAQARTWSLACP